MGGARSIRQPRSIQWSKKTAKVPNPHTYSTEVFLLFLSDCSHLYRPPCIPELLAESVPSASWRFAQIIVPCRRTLCPHSPKMGTLVSRQGRHLQRYTNLGRRKVVGCIPYRMLNPHTTITDGICSSSISDSLRILVVSSQKGHDILFPKGGWEMDESITEAATREAFEEAGVTGTVGDRPLGMWCYRSKSRDVVHEGIMFSLNVEEEARQWPEMYARQRVWVTVQEFKHRCPHAWMVEALDRLVLQLSNRAHALSPRLD